MAVRLVDVYRLKDAAKTLFALLADREKKVNISHRRMPTYAKHVRFVRSRPYRAWYLLVNGGERVGGTYLSKNNEIGVFVFKKFHGRGYGEEAVRLLMKKHLRVRRFLANINPRNKRSIRFFSKFGFKHIQNTYELRK